MKIIVPFLLSSLTALTANASNDTLVTFDPTPPYCIPADSGRRPDIVILVRNDPAMTPGEAIGMARRTSELLGAVTCVIPTVAVAVIDSNGDIPRE